MTDARTKVREVVASEAASRTAHGAPEGFFMANYDALRNSACRHLPGVALVAIDTRSGDVAGDSWIGRDAERPNALIVGRHSECDLSVDDPEVSLRHIAVLMPPGEVRLPEFSLHDLCSSLGFALAHDDHDDEGEENERVLAALVVRFGVVLFGPYMLFCFATGLGDWSDDAADAWANLRGETTATHETAEERENQSERAEERLAQRDRQGWSSPMGSAVSVIQGPLRTSDRLVAPGEEQLAELRVRFRDRVERLALGKSALDRGVLVGRSDRCASILTDSMISRVHVLVIACDGEVVAVDTASTGGTYRDHEARVPARVVLLSQGERAALANEHASVSLRSLARS